MRFMRAIRRDLRSKLTRFQSGATAYIMPLQILPRGEHVAAMLAMQPHILPNTRRPVRVRHSFARRRPSASDCYRHNLRQGRKSFTPLRGRGGALRLGLSLGLLVLHGGEACLS